MLTITNVALKLVRYLTNLTQPRPVKITHKIYLPNFLIRTNCTYKTYIIYAYPTCVGGRPTL
jgi:hypothetical protein